MSALQNSSKKIKNKSKVNESIMLLFICFIIETAMLFVVCIGALAVDVKSKNFYLLSAISLCLGCFVSGFVSVRKTKKNGLLNGILYCLPSNLLFIIVSSALNAFKVDCFTIISFVLLVIASAIGGVLSVNFKPKSKIKTKR